MRRRRRGVTSCSVSAVAARSGDGDSAGVCVLVDFTTLRPCATNREAKRSRCDGRAGADDGGTAGGSPDRSGG